MKTSLINKCSLIVLAILWLIVLILPSIIDELFNKYQWRHDTEKLVVIIKYTESNKEPILDTTNLSRINDFVVEQADNGNCPKKFMQNYHPGNSIIFSYKSEPFSNLLRNIILLFPPILLVFISKKFYEKKTISKLTGTCIKDSNVAKIFNHLESLKPFGLSKFQSFKDAPRNFYYDTLSIVSHGYKEIYGTEKTDYIFLFYLGTLKDIHFLVTEDDDKSDLIKFYSTINELGENKNYNSNPNYRIFRGLICDESEYNNSIEELGEWHNDSFKNIKNILINNKDPKVQAFLEELNKDVDFAVFRNSAPKGGVDFIIGFYCNKVTYVINEKYDKWEAKKSFFNYCFDTFFKDKINASNN